MKKIKQNGIGGIVSMMIYLAMGIAVGIDIGMNTDILDRYGVVMSMAVSVLSFYGAMVIQTIVHEGGHLLFGLLSGYEFLSFRIFSNIWVAHEGKIVRKKYNIPGTAGQCLMKPCDYSGGDFPYLMYNLGGGVMNIIFSTLILIFIKNVYMNGFLRLFLIFVSYFGYAMAAINLIPMRMSGISNDGKNITEIRKDPAIRRAFWCELYINAAITGGKRYSELEPWLLDMDGLDPASPIAAYIRAVNANVYLEKKEYEKAYEIYEQMLNEPSVKFSPSGIVANIEKVFLMMLMGMDDKDIEEEISPQMRKYMRMARVIPQMNRFEYAYELYVNKNNQNALKKEEEFEKALAFSPNIGDNLLEKELFLSFKQKYFAKFSETDV